MTGFSFLLSGQQHKAELGKKVPKNLHTFTEPYTHMQRMTNYTAWYEQLLFKECRKNEKMGKWPKYRSLDICTLSVRTKKKKII